MLAYAANRPRIGARQSSPNTMLFIICAHIVVAAAIISAKMTMPPTAFDPPTSVVSIPLPKAPPPRPIQAQVSPRAAAVTQAHPEVEPVVTLPPPVDTNTSPVNPATLIGSAGTVAIPELPPLPPAMPVTAPPQLLTSSSDLKPPYPESKLLTGEEAALTLRLTIDAQGRVIAVVPVGRADPVFLAAARRHLLAHWRYKPAMKDGRATESTTIVSLRFELDG